MSRARMTRRAAKKIWTNPRKTTRFLGAVAERLARAIVAAGERAILNGDTCRSLRARRRQLRRRPA